MAHAHTESIVQRSRSIPASLADRIGAACGLAFVALASASAALAGTPPDSDAGPTTIRSYLTSNTDRLGASTALFGLATLAIIGFFALVHRRIRVAEKEDGVLSAAFGLASATVVVAAVLATVIQAALVQHISATGDGSTLQSAYVIWMLVFHTAPSMGMAVALVCAAIAAVRFSAFPRWLAVLALASAGLSMVDDAADLTTSGSSLGPLGLVAFVLALTWIVGTSCVVLLRRSDEV
jgi:hypothetical protein